MYRSDASAGERFAAAPSLRRQKTSRYGALLKRLLDVVGSFFFLGAFFWLFAVLALLIKVRMGGPVIYAHTRIGHHGARFRCLKFRSMLPDSDRLLSEFLDSSSAAREEWEANFKLKNDPRVTALGRFLRSSSLDELPQFWNVLKGDMSLVGPRPVTEAELLKHYGGVAAVYCSMRPGLTGLWQVQGRSELGYGKRVDLDVRYVHDWSLVGDVRILFKTVTVVLLRRGAH